MSILEVIGQGFVASISYLMVAIGLLLAYKLVHDRITPFDDKQLLRDGNVAAAFSRAGAYLGMLLALSGSLIGSGESPTHIDAIRSFALNGVIAMVSLTLAVFVFNRILVRGHVSHEKIESGNTAVGVLEAFAYISVGMITCASFSGDGLPFWQGILSAVVFSALGLVTMIIVYVLYGLFWKWRQGCDIDEQVSEGNVAAAVDAGSFMLAIAITLFFSISGDFTGWANDFIWYGLAVASSTLVLPLARLLASDVLTRGIEPRGRGHHHENLGKSIVISCVSIGSGLLLGLVQFM